MKLKNREIDGAIFDVDGTLLDSMAIWEDAGARYLCVVPGLNRSRILGLSLIHISEPTRH